MSAGEQLQQKARGGGGASSGAVNPLMMGVNPMMMMAQAMMSQVGLLASPQLLTWTLAYPPECVMWATFGG